MDKVRAHSLSYKGTKPQSSVLVIIPAFNEEACIAGVVQDVKQNMAADVVVIDDGSTDQTAVAASKAGANVLCLPFNLGIGGAVQTGLKFAVETGYYYVLRLDGDGQHKIDEARKLIEMVQREEADVAIGSRFFPGQQSYFPPLSRSLGIRWFALLITLLTRNPAYDTTSGMQAMNRRAFTFLAKHFPQDYPEVESRVLLHKSKLCVKEIPVKMHPRAGGMSSITYLRAIYYMFKVSLSTLITTIRQVPKFDEKEE